MFAGKIEKNIEKQSEIIQKNDIYKFIKQQIKEISNLENSLLDLIKGIVFYKISKSNENRERYKEQILKTKEYLMKFGDIEELEKCFEPQDSLPSNSSSNENKYRSLEECFNAQNNY